jgi:hypothetical protein
MKPEYGCFVHSESAYEFNNWIKVLYSENANVTGEIDGRTD